MGLRRAANKWKLNPYFFDRLRVIKVLWILLQYGDMNMETILCKVLHQSVAIGACLMCHLQNIIYLPNKENMSKMFSTVLYYFFMLNVI